MATQKCPRKKRCKIHKNLSQKRSCLFQSMFKPVCNANVKMLGSLNYSVEFIHFLVFKMRSHSNEKLSHLKTHYHYAYHSFCLDYPCFILLSIATRTPSLNKQPLQESALVGCLIISQVRF